MAENFQDNIVYGTSTLAVSGDAIAIGSTNAGAKSVIFNNTGSQGHLAWQPTANRTINLPDSGGTIQLTGQAPGAIYDGANSITSGTIRFTNANGVSFSVNGQTISGSVAAQTNQSIGLYALGNTTQNSSTTLDARTLSFNGLGNITVGYSNGSIQISGAGGGGSVNFSAGTTSNNLSAITFSNSNGVSFGLNGSTITGSVANQTNQTVGIYAVSNSTQSSSGTLDARSLSFQGAGIASVGYTNGSVVISVPSGGGAGDGVNILAAGTQTANTTGTVLFSNSNGVSFGMSNNSVITASVAAGGGILSLYALGNTTQNSSTSLDAASISFNALGAATMGYSNGSIQVSVPNGVVSFSNANGVSFGSAGATTITASVAAQSVQTQSLIAGIYDGANSISTGTIRFSNANGVSFGINGQTITASAAGGGVALSAGANSTSTGTVVFSNSNGISFGLSANGVMTASVVAVAGSDIVFSNSNNIVFGKNVSTVTASALQPNISQFDPFGYLAINSASTLGQNSLYFVPFDVPEYLSAYRVNFFASIATTFGAANSSGTGGYTQSAAIYARDSGTNSTRITSQWSGSWFISYSGSSGTQINITHPIGISNSTAVSTTSSGLTTSNATTYVANSVAGFRAIAMPISSVMTPGRYWMAIAISTTSNNASNIINCSIMQISYSNNLAFRPFGTSSVASNASFYAIKDGIGTYSATSGAFPGTVIMNSDSIRAGLTAILPYFNFSGYTTATNMI